MTLIAFLHLTSKQSCNYYIYIIKKILINYFYFILLISLSDLNLIYFVICSYLRFLSYIQSSNILEDILSYIETGKNCLLRVKSLISYFSESNQLVNCDMKFLALEFMSKFLDLVNFIFTLFSCDSLKDTPSKQNTEDLNNLSNSIKTFHDSISLFIENYSVDLNLSFSNNFKNIFINTENLWQTFYNSKKLKYVTEPTLASKINFESLKNSISNEKSFEIKEQILRVFERSTSEKSFEEKYNQLENNYLNLSTELKSAKSIIIDYEKNVSFINETQSNSEMISLKQKVEKLEAIEKRLINENDSLIEALEVLETKNQSLPKTNIQDSKLDVFNAKVIPRDFKINTMRVGYIHNLLKTILPLPNIECTESLNCHIIPSSTNKLTLLPKVLFNF